MLTYITGDLMEAPEVLIAHGCNAQRKMGKGVAKLIRDKHPIAYYTYMSASQELGSVSFCGDDSYGEAKIIANAITQDGYRRSYKDDGIVYADYNAIQIAFEEINRFCAANEIEVIAIPKIGAGLAGGDWGTIETIVEGVMVNADVCVYCL